jgi:hypothetical protein
MKGRILLVLLMSAALAQGQADSRANASPANNPAPRKLRSRF